MELDRNPFWGIERSHTTNDIARMQKVKFKTTNRDETAQEYTVLKDDGEHGAEWSVGVTRMFFIIAAEQCGMDKIWLGLIKCSTMKLWCRLATISH